MVTPLILAINAMPNLKPNIKKIIAKKIITPDQMLAFKGSMLADFDLNLRPSAIRDAKYAHLLGKDLYENALREMEALTKANVDTICVLDKAYPFRLKQIHDAPFVLYYRGTWPNDNDPQLAIVGTRRPTLEAKNETSFIARELSGLVGSIVSGLAVGIDGQAHRSTVVAKGHTTAVLGGGFHRLYPSVHRNLVADILETGGLIMTEYGLNVSPTIYSFPMRNRVISGLSTGVLVMDAPHRSGSLITAQYGLDQGRDIIVHRCGVLNPDSGLLELQDQGAIVVHHADDIIAMWGLAQTASPYIIEEERPQPPTEMKETPRINANKKPHSSGYDLDNLLATKKWTWKGIWEEIGDGEPL